MYFVEWIFLFFFDKCLFFAENYKVVSNGDVFLNANLQSNKGCGSEMNPCQTVSQAILFIFFFLFLFQTGFQVSWIC
jgi:hypothetical protein